MSTLLLEFGVLLSSGENPEVRLKEQAEVGLGAGGESVFLLGELGGAGPLYFPLLFHEVFKVYLLINFDNY